MTNDHFVIFLSQITNITFHFRASMNGSPCNDLLPANTCYLHAYLSLYYTSLVHISYLYRTSIVYIKIYDIGIK